MEKKIIYIAVTILVSNLFLGGCSKREIDTDIPSCIEKILDDSTEKAKLQTIKTQYVDGDQHYWLNTDFSHFDGVEYIVNASCDTVCFTCGECLLPECLSDYKDWVDIWTK